MAVRNDTKRVEEVEEVVLCATILGYHAHNIKKICAIFAMHGLDTIP